MRSTVEAHLERAFALAYFFHPDRDAALGIAAQAVTKLRVAERTQGRRAYYQPVGRRLRYGGLIARARTKVSVERAQLLQRLVLHECDAIEREQEARDHAALDGDEFALRFVKHLVRIGTRRSSLYVAVAIGRILHGYSTADVLELVGTVVQDPERVPEDSYVRHVKRSLFDEVRERFGGLLRTRTGARGEETFETAPPTPSQRRLVARCLDLLTPWDTACLVPAGFDAMTQPLKQFRFSGTNPDDEHAIEVNRMHALIHPDCFERLAAGLRLQSPAERLALPRPMRTSDLGGGGPGGDREHPPRLLKNDIDQLGALWERQNRARRTSPFARVSVRVDGVEHMRLELEVGATAHCDLGAGAELVEIWGQTATEPEVLLGVHLLGPEPFALDRRREPATGVLAESVVGLGAGRELALFERAAGTDGSLRLDAICRESSRFAAFTRGWLALPSSGGSSARWVATASVAAAAGMVLMLAIWRGQDGETPSPGAPSPVAGTAGEQTRGESRTARPTTLPTARLIYLGSLAGPDGERVAELLRKSLAASGRFEPTGDVEAADAALKVEIGPQPPRPVPDAAGATEVRLQLRLVDEQGVVLWSADRSGPSWEVVVEDAVAALAHAASQ